MTCSQVVCVGNVVRDEVFHVDVLPSAGIKTDVLKYEERFGGPAATAAVAIAHLGGRTSYWGRVGDDASGKAIRTALMRHHVECEGLASLTNARTIRSIVTVDRRGERSIVVDRTGLPTAADCVPPTLPDATAVVLADTRWPVGARLAFQYAKAAGIPSILDADGGSADTMSVLVDLADHVVFSAQGATEFAGNGTPTEQLHRLAKLAPRTLAITDGARGSVWLIDGRIRKVPASNVVVNDTTGCGDVFHGAYALAIAEQKSPLWAAHFASAVAAIKAKNGNGWEGMPDRGSALVLMQKEISE